MSLHGLRFDFQNAERPHNMIKMTTLEFFLEYFKETKGKQNHNV